MLRTPNTKVNMPYPSTTAKKAPFLSLNELTKFRKIVGEKLPRTAFHLFSSKRGHLNLPLDKFRSYDTFPSTHLR